MGAEAEAEEAPEATAVPHSPSSIRAPSTSARASPRRSYAKLPDDREPAVRAAPADSVEAVRPVGATEIRDALASRSTAFGPARAPPRLNAVQARPAATDFVTADETHHESTSPALSLCRLLWRRRN